jgi:hypothetical protein
MAFIYMKYNAYSRSAPAVENGMRRATVPAMRRLSRRTLLAWAGIGVFVPSCLNPTLPLPPPEAPDARDIGNGQYRLRGALPVIGTVIIQNTRTEVLSGKGPLKFYDLVVGAEKGDTLILWYETDGDLSAAIAFQVDRLTPIVADGGA